jgi:hypothetical protein
MTDKATIYWYLPYLRALRDRHDYSYDVYGRFGMRFAADVRSRAMTLLREQSRFRFEGGGTTVSRAAFLKEIARARVCIDLPGNGDFCHRLVSYLAVGSCVVGARPGNRLHVPLEDGTHVSWAQEDLGDLVDLCAYYLEDDDARERMAMESRRFFDRYLHPDSLAVYYLRTCLDRIAGP